MSWRHSKCVAVRMFADLWRHVKLPTAKSRAFPASYQRKPFHSKSNMLGEQNVAGISSKHHHRDNKSISSDEEDTSTSNSGLLNLDISASKTEATKPQDIVGNSLSSNEPTVKKHPYIHYGAHLDPVVFHQLSQACVSPRRDSREREIFHPKFIPRNFYREAAEYEDTAVVFPRVGDKEAVANAHLFQRKTETLLDQLLLLHEIEDQLMLNLLESLAGCGDEYLLGLVEDERFTKLTKHFGDRCPHLQTDTFVKVLTLFARTQIRTSNPVMGIFETECEKRHVVWNVNTMLLVCDAWRLIGLPVRLFNSRVFDQIEQQWQQLTKHQVIQLVYLIGENRHAKTSLLNILQDHVLKNIATMSLMELGAVCQGFFKSRTNLKSALISALTERVQSEPLDRIHSFYLVGILKVFRQAYVGHKDLFSHIGNVVSSRLGTFPIESTMHVILTYATLHIHHGQLLEAAARELILGSQECRCKDLSKFLWSFATLNHQPEDSERFFRTLTSRMVQLLGEFEHFPVFLVSGLLSLAYFNRYNEELLNVVFSPRFILKINEYTRRANIDPRRDLFLLHASVKIDFPEYRGHHLSKEFLLSRPLSQGMFGSLPYELTSRPILRDVASALASLLGGEQYIKMGFILPHMKSADIEVHLDSSNRPVPFEAVDQVQMPPSLTSSKSSPSVTDSMDAERDQHVPLDVTLIANLSGEKPDKCRNKPAERRTAPSTLAGKETAPADEASDSVGDNEYVGTSRTLNSTELSVMSGTSQDTLLEVDQSANILSSQAFNSVDWSRLEVPEPLSDESGLRLAILVWSRNHFYFNGKKLLGLHSMKRRQLMKLGYKTIDIPFFEWEKLRGHREQKRYIRWKILKSNKNDL